MADDEVRVVVPTGAVEVAAAVTKAVVDFYLQGMTERRVLVVAVIPEQGGAIVAQVATTTELWDHSGPAVGPLIVEDLKRGVEVVRQQRRSGTA